MATHEVWKLAVDIALCLSLLFLAFRFFRTGHLLTHSRKTMELESTLRRLINDAREAGNELNDALYRRQMALEKALSSIEEAEGRIKSVTALADEKCSAIDDLLGRTKGVINQLKNSRQAAAIPDAPIRAPEPRMVEDCPQQRQPQRRIIDNRTEQRMQQPSMQAPAQRAYAAAQQPASAPVPSQPQQDAYAEWLDETASAAEAAAARTSSALRNAIEKEVSAPVKTKTPAASQESLRSKLEAALSANRQGTAGGAKVVEQMENIYQLAENLLRAGHDVDTVIAQTKLPPRKVQALSEMVERERAYGFDEQEKEPQSPQGLGALRSGKRPVDSI